MSFMWVTNHLADKLPHLFPHYNLVTVDYTSLLYLSGKNICQQIICWELCLPNIFNIPCNIYYQSFKISYILTEFRLCECAVFKFTTANHLRSTIPDFTHCFLMCDESFYAEKRYGFLHLFAPSMHLTRYRAKRDKVST